MIEQHPIYNTIGELEQDTKGMKLQGGIIRAIRKNFHVPVRYADIPGTYIQNILEIVRNRCLDFVNGVITELEFRETEIEIFQQLREEVDRSSPK